VDRAFLVAKARTLALTMRYDDEPMSTKGGIFSLLRPHRRQVSAAVVLTVISSGLNLAFPKLISYAIDTYIQQRVVLTTVIAGFSAVALATFLLIFLQGVFQTYTAEIVAKELRTRLIAKISNQDSAFIQKVTPAKLLTHLTSDIDAIKLFVSQAFPSIIGSVCVIIGASVLLISIDWELAVGVIATLPVIAVTFGIVLSKVRKLFLKAQAAIDWLNKVISESVIGAPLIRLVNSQHPEYDKFVAANTEARTISLSILRLFSTLIPVIIFCTNLATLMILILGGRFVIQGEMSIGDFTAFNSYLALLVFPVIVIGFMSNLISQASASYSRITSVLNAPDVKETGQVVGDLRGDIALRNVSLSLGGKEILKNVSFTIKAGTKTAIIGPTAAGKTQLLYLLTGLLKPASGYVEFDGRKVEEYEKQSLHQQVGFVFQDSIVFNLTLRENIAFSKTVTDDELEKAIATAELKDFIDSLPEKLDTIVSERGSNLSGGQKQRIMLARAIALNPKILLLDDFTARVDTSTERRILQNVHRDHPGITLVSVTQKIASVEDYDQIILLMEGEILASGTHRELLETSPEYVQIYDSQRSTSHYELHAKQG
jgi:ATP-binding cassette subfamily B protein